MVPGHAQTLLSKTQKKDSLLSTATPVIRDSTFIADSIRKRNIRKATKRSAIIPGWGQVTNKQAWKVPLVYAGLGIPAYLFVNNLKQYRILRDVYIILLDGDSTNNHLIPDNLKPLSPNSIRFYRNEFRRNVDYSALAFIIAWGINVVDATVYANLRGFDVSDNLTLQVSPQYDPVWRSGGLGFVLKPNNKPKNIITVTY